MNMFGPYPISPSKSPKSQSGRDGNEIELRTTDNYIQWRYKGFVQWQNLIALSEIKGEQGKPGFRGRDGKDGADGVKGEQGEQGEKGEPGIQGERGERGEIGPRGFPGRDGLPGVDGKPGKDGKDGKDAREIEFNISSTHIQWRFKGTYRWLNLVPLSKIKGDKGEQGEPGEPGERGPPGVAGARGFTGPAGTIADTFETISKNVRAWASVLAYTGDQLDTITYTKNGNNVIKTFNYTSGKLTSIVLSGDTPSGIDLTKTLSYTGDQLTGIGYS